MPLFKKYIALFDDSHNEMLNYEDEEYFEFKELLVKNNFTLKQCEKPILSQEDLSEIDILIIGNPINEYFSKEEIEIILNYTRSGGSLLLIAEFGGDFIQKTNLNDLSKNFGIFFESSIIKQDTNELSENIHIIKSFNKHKITNNLNKILIGGACTLKIREPAKPLCYAQTDSCIENYNDSLKLWIKDKEDKDLLIAACSKFGKGKVFAIGDVDLFSNNENIGIFELDNRKFVLNAINWLLESVKSEEVTSWVLDQIGAHREGIKSLNYKVGNLIETIMLMEKRITKIEDTFEKVLDNIAALKVKKPNDDKKRLQEKEESSYI